MKDSACTHSVHDGEVGDNLGPLSDLPDVADGEAIEEVHENHHDEDDEGEKVEIAQRHKVAVKIDRDVGELELTHKHGAGFDKSQEWIVEKCLEPVFLCSFLRSD